MVLLNHARLQGRIQSLEREGGVHFVGKVEDQKKKKKKGEAGWVKEAAISL